MYSNQRDAHCHGQTSTHTLSVQNLTLLRYKNTPLWTFAAASMSMPSSDMAVGSVLMVKHSVLFLCSYQYLTGGVSVKQVTVSHDVSNT